MKRRELKKLKRQLDATISQPMTTFVRNGESLVYPTSKLQSCPGRRDPNNKENHSHE